MKNPHEVHRLTVLGIDPGLASMGWGVVAVEEDIARAVDYGVLTTLPTTPASERLMYLHAELGRLMRRRHPQEVAIEFFLARNLRSALAVGQARGVALLAAAQHSLPVFEYTPLRVKQLVAGYGRGDKQQVQEMVRLQLGLDVVPEPDDAADALAVALCHLQERAAAAIIERSRGTA